MTFLALMHLSKDAETLGRRLEGLSRSVIKLFKPDPSQPNRRKLLVNGNFKEPPPLGATLRDDGCDFDSTPPEDKGTGKTGRPPGKVTKAIEFLEQTLAGGECKGSVVVSKWTDLGESKSTLFNARNVMVDEGRLEVDDSGNTHIWRFASVEAEQGWDYLSE